MKINQTDHIAANRRRQGLMAAGGLLGALAASSCCILPLAMFGLGVSGAWIGNLTQLAPYQPYFIAATTAFHTSVSALLREYLDKMIAEPLENDAASTNEWFFCGFRRRACDSRLIVS